ncbi:MAG: hypothetical protein F6K63_06305 [Moorea sp. SIO1G6]|uniref:hypothetical protein n=1 Tax=unclassified Moorena TaxID=2683338 RepID=UPI0013BAE8AF|nr:MULTISPECIES: hypothetical protein [unclassified Moorena]NEQ09369.1 hypothetical protein [Moorena sp. SIO4E2]NET64035.1 hypothetical protein [Moorena sp. SIO1G6]
MVRFTEFAHPTPDIVFFKGTGDVSIQPSANALRARNANRYQLIGGCVNLRRRFTAR